MRRWAKPDRFSGAQDTSGRLIACRASRKIYNDSVRYLPLLLAAPLLAGTTIHTDFEGGGLGPIDKTSDVHFRLGVKGEKDQDGRNRQASWYYFRVDGAPKTEIV